MEGVQAPSTKVRKKRKAESQENERLSKRLSLLNLERNGQRLYVPVEQPSALPKPKTPPRASRTQELDDSMHLDDTKHKVYIYDLDAELSSDSEASDDGRLVFLPDIKKHLRESRIPPVVLANSDGELAGMNKQLVLYNVPSSLTVPEEQDSVRRAIIESRARARARARLGKDGVRPEENNRTKLWVPEWNKEWLNGSGNTPVVPSSSRGAEVDVPMIPATTEEAEDDDPDAMDLG